MADHHGAERRRLNDDDTDAASPRAGGARAFGEYNPYDETTDRYTDESGRGKRRVFFDWNGNSSAPGDRRRSAFCCFGLPLLVVLALTLIGALVLGILAAKFNEGTDFGPDCGFVNDGPRGLAITAGCVLVLLLPFAVFTRPVWFYTRAPTYTCCPAAGMVCARVGWTAALLVLVVIAYGGVGIGDIFLTMTLQQPELTQTITAGGSGAPVTISRDANGLVHIVARSIEDALFGQGYAQGQDRLWQIEFQRLVAQGRLAEHVGHAGLKIDKQLRRLGIAAAARKMCAHATAAELAKLNAFAAGVNAYMQHNKQRPIEFSYMSTHWWPLVRHEPAAFAAVDVCYAAKMLQLQLGGNLKQEAERFRMWWAKKDAASHPPAAAAMYDRINALYTNQTDIDHTILTAAQMGITAADVTAQRAREAATFARERELYATEFAALRDSGRFGAPYSDDDVDNADPDRAPPTAGPRPYDLFEMIQDHASNAWAARTGTGAACGASDPHLNVNLPSVWYFTHLTVRGGTGADPDAITYETSGVGMAGVPGVHIGKNQHVSWGITMAITDLQDLYIIANTTGDGYRLANGTVVPFTTRVEHIRYKKGFLGFGAVGTETIVVKETVYGPDVAPMIQFPSGMVASLKSPILEDDATSVSAVLGFLDPALRTTSDLCGLVFQRLRSPAFSVPSADDQGNLGYCISGAYRDRAVGHTGMWPTVGDGRFDDAASEIPAGELPQLQRTAAQVAAAGGDSISCANQKIYPDGYSHALGYEYVPPLRGGRLQIALGDPSHRSQLSDIAFHRSLQTDTTSNLWVLRIGPLFRQRRQALFAALNATSSPAAASATLRSWLAWNGSTPIGSPEATPFWRFIRELASVAGPVTGIVDQEHWPHLLFVPMLLEAVNGSSTVNPATVAFLNELCDDWLATRPPLGGGGDGLPSACWRAAAVAIGAAASQAPAAWGRDLARLDATNLMMHKSPLGCVFDRSWEKDGDPSSVNVKGFKVSGGPEFSAGAASSMRQLYDWAKPGTVHFAWPGGASGYPYSVRYDNFAGRFTADEYVEVPVIGGTSNVSVVDTTVLNP
jgi:penicillin amidase